MRSSTAVFLLAGAAAVAPVLSETVHGVVVFSRHGDRTAKFFKGYEVTNLGANQVYSTGSLYRARYIEDGAPYQILNISPDLYTPSQLYATVPEQDIHLQSAANFLQGLYPPLGSINTDIATETLANGSEIISPLNGYQFITINSASEQEPNTIWLKGDDACPAFTEASDSYEQSTEYISLLDSTRDFYTQFAPLLSNILPAAKVNYAKAYDVWDLLHVATIHNSTANLTTLTPTLLNQLQGYASTSELARNFNSSQPVRSIGGQTLAGTILRQLNQTVSSRGQGVKFSFLAGSYDTFLAFFGLSDLIPVDANFSGLPTYASTLTFELFTEGDVDDFPADESDLRVRFLFRNGTSDAVPERNPWVAFPLFGRDDVSMSWSEFRDGITERAILNVADWCRLCRATVAFCSPEYLDPASSSSSSPPPEDNTSSGLTRVQAGVVGAMTTLAVFALAAVAFALLRRSKKTPAPVSEKRRLSSSDSSHDGALKA